MLKDLKEPESLDSVAKRISFNNLRRAVSILWAVFKPGWKKFCMRFCFRKDSSWSNTFFSNTFEIGVQNRMVLWMLFWKWGDSSYLKRSGNLPVERHFFDKRPGPGLTTVSRGASSDRYSGFLPEGRTCHCRMVAGAPHRKNFLGKSQGAQEATAHASAHAMVATRDVSEGLWGSERFGSYEGLGSFEGSDKHVRRHTHRHPHTDMNSKSTHWR